MIDARLQPLQRAALRHPAQMLAARGVMADTISIAGFAVGLLAVAALALGWWTAALVLL